MDIAKTTAFPTDALHKANIDRFDGDREVSGRCQEGVCVTLNTAWGVIMPNQLIKIQSRNIGHYFSGFLLSQ